MTLWCIFRSPLIMGGEMRDNDQWTLDLLTNEEVLRVLNHTSGGEQIFRTEEKVAWKSVDEDGSVYAALFNIGDEEAEVSVSFEELELSERKRS